MEIDQIKLLRQKFKAEQQIVDETFKLNKLYKKTYGSLTKQKRNFISLYKGMGYSDINSAMMNVNFNVYINTYSEMLKIKPVKHKYTEFGEVISISKAKKEEYTKKLAALLYKINVILNTIIDDCPKIKLGKLYKGVFLSEGNSLLSLKKGDIFTFNNLCSSTYDINTALNFARPSFDNNVYICVFKINTKVKCLFLPWNIDNLGENYIEDDEFEILLNHGLTCKLMMIKKEKMGMTGIYSEKKEKNLILYMFEYIDFKKIEDIEVTKKSIISNLNIV
jgi:hypothetical protein